MRTSDITCVYSDNIPISSNMENRNCLRRIARHDETEFSNQSIMNAMEKFVKSVNDMDETILVPCRLMDLKVGDADDTIVEIKQSSKHPVSGNMGKRSKFSLSDLASTDLYNLYTMVNSVKNELLWGPNMAPEEEEDRQKSSGGGGVNSTSISSVKGHVRRPSTVSMTSTNSTASISDSDSDTGNENDSGIEAEENNRPEPNYSLQVAENFRRHLHGLHHSLRQMTEAATYLTTRYQNDVGGAV